MEKHHDHGQCVLRIGLGILFFGAGLMKLFFAGPEGIKAMLSGVGFVIPGFLAWVLILAEIIGGAALIIGYKHKWASILLGFIIVSALLTVQVKTFGQDFPAQMQFFKDIVILGGLAAIGLGGAGHWSIDSRKTITSIQIPIETKTETPQQPFS